MHLNDRHIPQDVLSEGSRSPCLRQLGPHQARSRNSMQFSHDGGTSPTASAIITATQEAATGRKADIQTTAPLPAGIPSQGLHWDAG